MPGLLDLLAGPVKGLVGAVGGIIDDLHTSGEEKAAAKLALLQASAAFEMQMAQAQRDVLVAEIKGESFIQRAWRPLTMLTFVAIIANNYIVVPYAVSFGLSVPMLEIPPGMWGLLTVGIGGYIGARTYEKKLKNGHGDASTTT